MKKHQKKRNSLLLYEFLVKTISRGLIEDDKRRSSTALKILKRHYRPGSEIYKEFRLMNSLAKTSVTSEHAASTILREARTVSEAIDSQRLDREKSLLIRNINHGLNDPDFYDQQVDEYKTYATIQTLVNEWRSKEKDLTLMATFEDHLVNHLLSERKSDTGAALSEDTPGTARLLMKVMTKKLNEKYSSVLNKHQRSLIKAYAYSEASSDSASIRFKLEEIRNSLVRLIDENIVDNDHYMKEKLFKTKSVLLQESFDDVDDTTVTRFMLYAKLTDELQTKE